MMLPFRKIHRTFRLAAVWILMGLTLSACKKNAAESSESTSDTKLAGNLSTLQMMHPRLLLTDTRLQELKALSLTDARLQNYVNDVLAQAEKDLVKAPIQHVLIGPRLLDKSRECLLRVYDLSFAYRWTGNEKYLNGALSNLKTVCAFADWNPSHFLDVAEMSHAVAIGYDWLFNKMDTNTRQLIHSSLINLGLNEGKSAYAANAWWFNSEYNWNQVCNGGLTIGALAVADTDPLLATTILNKAVAGLPYALKSYGPDGVWCEGPGYWGYATEYTCYLLSALKTALGNTFGLTTATGMNLTGYFPIYASGPTGYMLNYADAGEKSKIGAPHPEMFLASL
ncbi:MAG: hypothetical protein LWW85_10330, partial [Marinilabiliales bacterium]|nr:hypothetical protein [Marinilabiliales bacterium]